MVAFNSILTPLTHCAHLQVVHFKYGLWIGKLILLKVVIQSGARCAEIRYSSSFKKQEGREKA